MNIITGQIKYWWQARSKRWKPVADWMNQVGWYLEHIDAVWPLVSERANGTIRIGIASGSGSAFAHPWRLAVGGTSGSRTYTVAGGQLSDGATWHDVAAIEETALTGSMKVWLQVKYYNDPATPAEHTIEVGADWPTDDYETDTVPNALDPTTLPAAGWCLTHIRLAEYSAAGGVVQHVFSDVLLPYGRTYAISRVLDHQWASSVMQHIVAVDTMVRGIVIATAAPTLDSVFDTGPCPQ